MKLSEHEVEILAERRMDRLDKRYLEGELTETQYNQEVETIRLFVKNNS